MSMSRKTKMEELPQADGDEGNMTTKHNVECPESGPGPEKDNRENLAKFKYLQISQ